METTNKEKLYPLPFFRKIKPNLWLKSLFLFGSLFFLLRPIYVIITWEEQWRIYNRRLIHIRDMDPHTEVIAGFCILLGLFYLFIRYRNNYLKMTETHIEKKFYNKTKKVQWTEIQDVELFYKTIVDEYGTLKEYNHGPSIGILLKDQSSPWRNHTNDAGKYYIVLSNLYFADIAYDKLYLTIKNQIERHNSNSTSANVLEQTKPS